MSPDQRSYNHPYCVLPEHEVMELVPIYTAHWIVIVIIAAVLVAIFFLR